MRTIGPRRGNPAVRFMIEQTARRRMSSALGVDRGGLDTSATSEGSVRRWTREFFEEVHGLLLPRMAHVEDTPEGVLRYYGTPALRAWGFVTAHATVLAYEHDETPGEIRERSRRWLACLRTRTAPGLASSHWGHPVYGARLDPLSGELDVVWAFAGEWCDAVLAGALPEREWDAPRSWTAATSPAS